MKKLNLLLLGLIFLTLGLNAQNYNYGGGSGTSTNPYILSLPVHVDSMVNIERNNYNINKTYFILNNNIDLSDYINNNYPVTGWFPQETKYGTIAGPRYIVLDGRNNTLSGLWTDNTTQDCIGLFRCLENSEVKNLNIITHERGIKGRQTVGILCGVISDCSFINCHVRGKVEGHINVGGLFGFLGSMGKELFENLSSNVTVKGATDVGGLCGGITATNFSTGVIFKNCYAEGEVTCSDYGAGGFSPSLNSPENITQILNCYSLATVNSRNDFFNTGGFIGRYGGGEIINCYSAGNLPFNGGGFLGAISSPRGTEHIEGCYFDKIVSGKEDGYLISRYEVSLDLHGKSTQEMMKQITFRNWDFVNIWKIDEDNSYPYFQIQGDSGDFADGDNTQWQDDFTTPGNKTVSEALGSNGDNRNVNIFPNPTTGIINIDLDIENPEIKIYDLQGRIIIKTSNNNKINLSDFPAGTYFIEVNGNIQQIIKN